MVQKQIEVDCPCCDSRLVIDVLTAKVLKHVPPTKLDETGRPVLDGGRWDAASKRVKGRESRGTASFDAAVGKERSREDELDDLFRKAQDKLKRRREDDLL